MNFLVRYMVIGIIVLSIDVYAQSKMSYSTTSLRTASVVVDPSSPGKMVADNFVGFSFNPAYSSQFFGTSYNGNNSRMVTARLLNNLYPFQKSGIRINGANNSYWKRTSSAYANAPTAWNNSTTSFSYIPLTTPTFSTTIDQTDLNDIEGLFDGLSYTPTILFGINLAVIDDGRSADFASNITSTLKNSQRPDLDLQFEIGNEPDAFVSNGRRLTGYTYSNYQQEFNLIANAVKHYGEIAGPALAKPTYTQEFAGNLGNFIASANANVGSGKLKTISYHDYPMGLAADGTASSFLPKYFTSDPSSSKYAGKYTELEVTQDLAPSITIANQNGINFRMAETSSIGGGGEDSASNSFGAALWAIDFMYELAKAGGDGINFAIEGSSTAYYSPWTFNSTQIGSGIVLVRPFYYGTVFFARAVQNHAQFINNTFTLTGSPHLKVWSTKDNAGIVRVMVINKGTSLNDDTTCAVTIKIPSSVSNATMYELKPLSGGIAAVTGTTINGQSIVQSGSTAGEFAGTATAPAVIRTFNNDTTSFSFPVSAASAIILETTSSVLPVELTSFMVEKIFNKALLQWTTATEANNYGFEIERRTYDGSYSAWTTVGFVEGAGNSNTSNNYSFSDANLCKGKIDYRLKQIDRNGNHFYSTTIDLQNVPPQSVSLGQNYPNPFNPSTTIEFSFPTQGTATLSVQNVIGQKVAELFSGNVDAGNNYQITWDAEQFSSGIYFSVLKFNGNIMMRKMLLIK